MNTGLTKFARERKKVWSRSLQKVLKDVRKEGKSLEQMSVDLGVGRESVWLWMNGQRVPKYPTIRFIEQTYGVKIIQEGK